MYAITGITGRVGGIVAHSLLAAKKPVRAVVRDPEKGAVWRKRGCQVAVAEMDDAAALAAAFKGTEGVFILPPPVFDPKPGFPEAWDYADAVRSAIEKAGPAKVVCISTVGAHSTRPNLLTQISLMEQALGELEIPVVFLRPGWYMENAAWDVPPARNTGVIQSFLQPLDKQFPMVAIADVGRTAAELLQEKWSGQRIVELEGPRRISPNDIAAEFSKILGRPVRIEVIPRPSWEALFKSQGMTNPTPRIQMLDGFNEAWIEFENGEAGSVKGTVELETVLKDLVKHPAGNTEKVI